MKNLRLYVPLFLAMALCFYAIGCGSNATGGGSGGGSLFSGKLSDPYITGATVYVDENNSGSWDAGEPKATTGSTGTFTFTSAPSIGATIRIYIQGDLCGVTYDADLARIVDNGGNLNVTPLTTLLSVGISADSIQHILNDYAGILISTSDVTADPMAGLDLDSATSIARIRGAVCIYSLMSILSFEAAGNPYFDLASFETTDNIQAMGYMGAAVISGLSDEVLTNINVSLDALQPVIKAAIEGTFPGSTATVNFPSADATDIANSAFAVTRYVISKAIVTGPPTWNPGVYDSTIEALGADIGQRYYTLRNRNTNIISISIPTPFGSITSHATMTDGMVSNEVFDPSGNPITTFEVNDLTKGFMVNETTGTIEPIF